MKNNIKLGIGIVAIFAAGFWVGRATKPQNFETSKKKVEHEKQRIENLDSADFEREFNRRFGTNKP